MADKPYILYIEDERPVIELVRQALQGMRLEVVGVTAAAEGLAAMRDHKPALLLLDLMMPDMSGWDLYRAMKADPNLAGIPVIVITAQVPETGCCIVPDLPPVDDYITKPFSVARLIRAVQNVLTPGAG
ncbi:MAG: response regulator [Chloroflexota bacterium]